MNICTLNKIAACGTDRLGAGYTVTDTLDNADGVMVRSAAMHDMALPQSLLAIARARAQASTTFRSTNAATRASWCSTRPAPTPTRSRNW